MVLSRLLWSWVAVVVGTVVATSFSQRRQVGGVTVVDVTVKGVTVVVVTVVSCRLSLVTVVGLLRTESPMKRFQLFQESAV